MSRKKVCANRWIDSSRLGYFLYLPFICSVLIACSKIDVFDGNEGEVVKTRLIDYQDNNVSVNSFKYTKGIIRFFLSDGSEIGFEISCTPVLTIDVMGIWRLNDERRQESLEIPGYEIINSLASEKEIIGIIEGYTDWSFMFKDKSIISLKKTLYTSDPDSIVRGINHRGYCINAPENTLPAFRLSKLMGFRYVEADIRFTSDEIPVLLHDETINRTSNGDGDIKDLKWDDIRSWDFGKWKSSEFEGTKIPSLEEFLILCQKVDLWPYIELKTGTMEQIKSVVSLVNEYGLKGKTIYISFSFPLLQVVLEADPTATVGLLLSTVTENAIQMALKLDTGVNSIFIDSFDYSDEAVSLCKTASLRLEVWTINSEATILSLPDYISGVTSNSLHAGRVLRDRGGK